MNVGEWRLLDVRSRLTLVMRVVGGGETRTVHEVGWTRFTVRTPAGLATAGAPSARREDVVEELVREAGRPSSLLAVPAEARPRLHQEGDHAEAAWAQEDFELPGWLSPSRSEHEETAYTITSSTGADFAEHIDQRWTGLEHDGVLTGWVPEGAAVRTGMRPEANGDFVLLSPWVLSQLLLDDVVRGLVTGQESWPHVTITDPARFAATDMDGTSRCSVCFVAGGRLKARPANLAAGLRSGHPLTGHGGLSGTVVRELSVVPGSGPASRVLVNGVIARSATAVPGRCDRTLLVLDLSGSSRPRRMVLALPGSVLTLLDHGRWCGPVLRGRGGWISQWLAVAADMEKQGVRS